MSELETKTIDLHVPTYLGVSEYQTIKVGFGILNKPKPLMAFDFDGTLFKGFMTYYQAAMEIVMMYSGDVSRVPSVDDFEKGVHPDLHSWGVPTYVPLDDAWDIFANLIVRIEGRNPGYLFPSVPAQLQEISEKFHLVIVTLNSIHSVADKIKSETGLDLDVIVVEKKALVLQYLARWHLRYYTFSNTPFYYFGDTAGDMKEASSVHGLVYPVAVTKREILSSQSLRQSWCSRMQGYGARAFVSHERISSVVKGEHFINPMLI